MVKITFLGACQEVGRSGVLIESETSGDAILCDYGTKMDANEQTFPVHVSGKNLTAIVLTHAHIDHSGGIPLFYISGSVPLYCTELTYRVTEVLLQDMLNISESYLPFEKPEIDKMRRYTQFLKFKERKKVGKTTWLTLFNAGHIPGSALVLIEIDGKRLIYTGDINSNQTRLMTPLDVSEYPEIDAIITECTYGTSDHPNRMKLENEFINDINEIITKKGVVTIPAFGVARSQEILSIIFRDGNVAFPVTLDGMARKIALLYDKHPSMIRDSQSYKNVLGFTHFMAQRSSSDARVNCTKTPGVIIAPSGMLKGGTSRIYVESIVNDENSGVFLVSYQVLNTPGKFLLEKGQLVDNNMQNPLPVKFKYKHFDFSSHSGVSDLIAFLQQLKFINPQQKRVFCVHGDKEIMMSFAEKIKSLGFIVDTPVENQHFNI